MEDAINAVDTGGQQVLEVIVPGDFVDNHGDNLGRVVFVVDGIEQSGMGVYKLADFVQDKEIALHAAAQAKALVKEDPNLEKHPIIKAHMDWLMKYKLAWGAVG